MKRVMAFMLAAMLVLSLVACSGKTTSNSSATVALPKYNDKVNSFESASMLGLSEYLAMRFYIDALINYDYETGNSDEISEMVQGAILAGESCQTVCDTVDEMYGYIENSTFTDSSAKIMQAKANTALTNPFIMTAAAAEDDDAMAWAEALAKQYDSYPAGQQLRKFAEHLGTDAKTAYKILQDVHETISERANDEAAWNNEVINRLKTYVATTKIALSGYAAATTGTGIIETGGLICSTVDTVLSITETGASIFLGDNDKTTVGIGELQDKLAPVIAVGGLISTGSSIASGGWSKWLEENPHEIVSLVGNEATGLLTEGKLLGFDVKKDGDETKLTRTDISVTGRTQDEIDDELKKSGLPETKELTQTKQPSSKDLKALAEKLKTNTPKDKEELEKELTEIKKSVIPEEELTGGYWKLVGMQETEDGTDFDADGINDKSPFTVTNDVYSRKTVWSGSKGSFRFEETYPYSYAYHPAHDGDCKNEGVTFDVTTSAPKSTYKPVETIEIDARIVPNKSSYFCSVAGCEAFARLTGINPDKDQPFAAWGNETNLDTVDGEKIKISNDGMSSDCILNTVSGTLTGNMPEGSENGDIIYLLIGANCSPTLATAYKYEWVK